MRRSRSLDSLILENGNFKALHMDSNYNDAIEEVINIMCFKSEYFRPNIIHNKVVIMWVT